MNRGRPKDPIWEHFLEKIIDEKTFVQCKLCGYKMSPKICRMKNHHSKCGKPVKVEIKDPAEDVTEQSRPPAAKRKREQSASSTVAQN